MVLIGNARGAAGSKLYYICTATYSNDCIAVPMYKPQCRKHKYTSASPTIRGIYTDYELEVYCI